MGVGVGPFPFGRKTSLMAGGRIGQQSVGQRVVNTRSEGVVGVGHVATGRQGQHLHDTLQAVAYRRILARLP